MTSPGTAATSGAERGKRLAEESSGVDMTQSPPFSRCGVCVETSEFRATRPEPQPTGNKGDAEKDHRKQADVGASVAGPRTSARNVDGVERDEGKGEGPEKDAERCRDAIGDKRNRMILLQTALLWCSRRIDIDTSFVSGK